MISNTKIILWFYSLLYLEFQESTLVHSNSFKTQLCKFSFHSFRHGTAFRDQLRCAGCAGIGSRVFINTLEDRMPY